MHNFGQQITHRALLNQKFQSCFFLSYTTNTNQPSFTMLRGHIASHCLIITKNISFEFLRRNCLEWNVIFHQQMNSFLSKKGDRRHLEYVKNRIFCQLSSTTPFAGSRSLILHKKAFDMSFRLLAYVPCYLCINLRVCSAQPLLSNSV